MPPGAVMVYDACPSEKKGRCSLERPLSSRCCAKHGLLCRGGAVTTNTSNGNDAVPIETAGVPSLGDWLGVYLNSIFLRVNMFLERANDEDR
eukprot:7134646-Pyramimonas_sp.AAC.1